MDEKLNVALGWLREYTAVTIKIENYVHRLNEMSPKLREMKTSIETVPAEEANAAIAAFKSASKDDKELKDVLNMAESFKETCLQNLLQCEEVCISTIFEMRTLAHLKLEHEWKVAIFIPLDCKDGQRIIKLASQHQIQIIGKPNFEMGTTSAAPTSSHASYKVALLGAAGEIGEPLALLIKMSPRVSALNLYDTKDVKGVGADLNHCNTPAQVLDFTGASELANSLKGVDVVVISAQVPNIMMLSMMTHDDLFNINASIVKNLVEAVADNCPEALIHIISNSVNSIVPLAAEVLKQKGVYNPKKLFGVTTLDVVRANTFVAHEKNLKPTDVDVPVVGGHAGITILPLLSKRKPSVNLTDEEVENLTMKIQNAGTEVVEAKGGVGSASLSVAYAAARFIESSLRALDGDGDVYECSYVESHLTELTFFASRVKLGRNGVEALVPSDLQGLTEHEQKALEALKPELKASIENGIAFANKQAVTVTA